MDYIDIISTLIISSSIVGTWLYFGFRQSRKIEEKIANANCTACGEILGEQDFSARWGVRMDPFPKDSVGCGYSIICSSCEKKFKVSDDGWIVNKYYKKEEKLISINKEVN